MSIQIARALLGIALLPLFMGASTCAIGNATPNAMPSRISEDGGFVMDPTETFQNINGVIFEVNQQQYAVKFANVNQTTKKWSAEILAGSGTYDCWGVLNVKDAAGVPQSYKSPVTNNVNVP